MQLTQPTTRTLEAPGAVLTYDVRPGIGADIPLFLIFPSHHGGFLGGEYGWPGEPDALASRLRSVLDAESSGERTKP